MYEPELIKKQCGDRFGEMYNNFVNDFKEYEKKSNFFTKDNSIEDYVIMNLNSHSFEIAF